jgi:low affinity Fe/Cu permease
MVKQNEGRVDRILRLMVAVIIAAAAFYKFTGTWQIVLYVIAAIFLITSITGFCALYKLFGISTKK